MGEGDVGALLRRIRLDDSVRVEREKNCCDDEEEEGTTDHENAFGVHAHTVDEHATPEELASHPVGKHSQQTPVQCKEEVHTA